MNRIVKGLSVLLMLASIQFCVSTAYADDVLQKPYHGPNKVNELPQDLTTCGPALKVNGISVSPLANENTDVTISTGSDIQVWTLMQEYTPWVDVNRFGFYTDLGAGNTRTLIFRGPNSAGFKDTTNLAAGTQLGLWLLNDTNGDTVYSNGDSWLFSQRSLTRGSFSNEHQWFMVYDVRAYKYTGAYYSFESPTEDYSFTGNYDYLFFIDDDHTSANWDHNDMIAGVLCNRPPVVTCHGDTTISLCSPGQIAISGFGATDPDNNLQSITVNLGTYNNGTVRFTPSGSGLYQIRLIAVDTWGAADTCFTNVNVTVNSRPDAVSPASGALFVCDLSQICVPGFMATDPDNNLVSTILIGGTLHGDTACFNPVQGANLLKIIATDACGLADTSITVYTITKNSPPDAVSPSNSSQFVCDLSQICIPGFTASDIDGNLASTVLLGGTLSGNTACFTPVAGANTLRLVATDACGKADTSVTIVTVTVNNAPDAVSPSNSSQFLCDLSQICIPGFTASDADDNLTSTILQGGTLSGETACFTPVAGANTLRLIATDACGKADTSVTVVTVNVNHTPDAVSPANMNQFVCDLSQICIPGFSATDVDGNLTSTVLQGGTLSGNTACFTPVLGANTLRLIATDACGKADTAITVITVSMNRPPDAIVPSNQTMFVCDLSQLCIPGFSANDPDGNLSSTILLGGTLNGESACFTPVVGANTLRLIATDACGAVDTATTVVTINLNHAPDAVSPANSSQFVCDFSQICIPGFTATDIDGNLTSTILQGGTLSGDNACFTPVAGANTLRLIATDACGKADTSVTVVTITVNQAPDAVSPSNSSQFVCNLDQICIPGFSASDADGNLVSTILQGGVLSGGTVCFTPVAGANTLRLIATDACGKADTSVTVVTVNLNHSPDAVSPTNSNQFVCDLSQICIPGFAATDIDGNLTSTILQGGTLSGGSACFIPVVGANTLRLIATDACGRADTSVTVVTVTINRAPDAVSPANSNQFVCDLSQICIPGFSATDVDGNLVSTVLQGGTLSGGSACFTPVIGANTLRLIATDACGLADTSVTVVTITLNQPPVAVSPADAGQFVCDLSQICLPGFTASDIDNNIVSRNLIGGTLHGDTACFTPVVGANELRFIVEDACGKADTSLTIITITLNHVPVAVSPADQPMFLCAPGPVNLTGFNATDADNNLVSKVLIGGTLVGDIATFDAVAGPNTLQIIATDACGASDTNTTVVTVTINSAPQVSSPADTAFVMPSLTSICLPGFTGSDIDNNISTRVILGGTLNGDTACFMPVQGVNTLTLIYTDVCGAADTSITHITVNVAIALAVSGGTIPEFYEEAADSFFVDITGGDPGTLAIAGDFTEHSGEPSRYSATLNGSVIRIAVTFDYLDEFSSANTPFAYQLIAFDGYSADTLDLSLIVHDTNRIPSVSSINDTTIHVGSTLVFAVTGSDLDSDNTLTLTKASGPGTFNSTPGFPPVTGNFSWTPSMANLGTSLAIFAVDDARSGSASDTVSITVTPSGINMAVIGGTPPVFTEEVADSFFIDLGGFDPSSLVIDASFPGHSGAPARYSATVVGNSVRFYATFDYLGEFSNAGSPFNYRLIAHDNYSADTLVLSLIVNDNNRIPEISSGLAYTVRVDHPLTFTVSATDLDSDNTLSLAKVFGPGDFAGASGPSPVSAGYSWTPTSADLPGSPYTLMFAVGDGRGGVDTARVTVTVFPDGAPIIHIVSSPTVFREGMLDSLVFTAGDPDGDPLGGFGYKFLAPESTFSGASFRVHNDTAFLRLTYNYVGSWSSSSSPFPLRLLGYSMVATTDSAFLDVQLTVLNVNRKPDLVVTGPHTIEAGNNLGLELHTTDLDTDDNLTLSASGLPPAAHLIDNGNGAGNVNWTTAIGDTGSYMFRFFVNDNRGVTNSMDTVLWSMTVTAPDTGGGGGGQVGLEMGCPTAVPGTDVLVPVYLHTPDTYTGGIELLIGWDPTVLSLLDVLPSVRLNNGDEYFNIHRDDSGIGTVRVVWIANINDGNYTAPMVPGHETIMWLNFHIAPGEFLFGVNVPIEFRITHYSDNTISDSTGYQLIWPLLTSGCVNIENPSTYQGDPNMNCQYYEIADAVLVARRLIEGFGVWAQDDYMTNEPGCSRHLVGNDPVQESASDLNINGFTDIADLVRFINIINGYVNPPKLDPATGFATLTMPGQITAMTEIKISSSCEIGGALVKIAHSNLELGTPIAADGMEIMSLDSDGVLTVLIYSMSGNRIPAGNNVLFTLPIVGDGTMSFAETQVADSYGRLIESVASVELALPLATTLTQNYPNPFNPTTTLRLAMANDGFVKLVIYDISGRQVKQLVSGEMIAGYHDIVWDGTCDTGEKVTSGVYFARMQHDTAEKTIKMMMLK